MGKARLMACRGPAHLGGKPVGYPEVGAHLTEKLFDHDLAAARPDAKAGAVPIVKHPRPPRLLADARAGLVRLATGPRQQPFPDQVGLAGKGVATLAQHVGKRPLADLPVSYTHLRAHETRHD